MSRLVAKHISSDISVKVKRGCSEYALAYPEYGEFNENGPQKMEYIEEWFPKELEYDKSNAPICTDHIKTLTGLNLDDVLIMETWLEYALGLEDQSLASISLGSKRYPFLFDEAERRRNSKNV